MENKINSFATSCCGMASERLDRVRNTQIHETANAQPLIGTVRQRRGEAALPWTRPWDAWGWAMRKMCSLCSNSWQKGAWSTGDGLHVLYSEATGHTENYLHQDTLASLATDRFTWRKFVVVCSAAE